MRRQAARARISYNVLSAKNGITLKGSSISLNGLLTVPSAGAGVSVTGPTTLNPGAGTITLTGSNAANDVTLGAVDGNRPLVIIAGGGHIVMGAAGTGTPLASIALTSSTANLSAVTTVGAQNYGGVATTTLGGPLIVTTAGVGVTAGATQLAAGGASITLTGSSAANDVTLGTVNGTGALNITAAGGDVVLGVVGGSNPPAGVAVSAATVSLQDVNDDRRPDLQRDRVGGERDARRRRRVDRGEQRQQRLHGDDHAQGDGADPFHPDTNNLTLATPTLGNTHFTAIANGTLTLPSTTIDAGSGSIDFGSNTGALALLKPIITNNGDVKLVGTGGLTVGDDITTSGGNVALTGGGATGLSISGGKTVGAGGGTICSTAAQRPSISTRRRCATTNATASAVTIRNATTVTLGDITATSGTVQVGVAGDVSGAVTQQNGRTLAAGRSRRARAAASRSAARAGGSCRSTTSAPIRRGGDLTLHDTGGGLTLTGDITSGSTATAVTITTTGGALDLGGHAITTTARTTSC